MAAIDLSGYGYDPMTYGGSSPSPNTGTIFDPQYGAADDPSRIKKQPVPTTSPALPSLGGPSNATADQVSQLYQQYLGRKAGYYSNGSLDPGDTWQGYTSMPLDQVEAQVANSAEAQAYKNRGGATPNPNDPNYSLLMNTVLSRLNQLSQPVDTTAQNAFATSAMDRVAQLSGAPYSDQQSQALLTKNLQPLTQARDQAKQQKALELARRGFTPNSGLFQSEMGKIDQAYERAVANVTNTLNVSGIDRLDKNASTSLDLLNAIVNMNRTTQADNEARFAQLVPTAGVMSNLDTQRLGSLNQSAGIDDPSRMLLALNSLLSTSQSAQSAQDQRDAASAASLAQLVYALMNGMPGLFS